MIATITQEALASVSPNSEFSQLRRIIKRQGLLEKQPAYYTFKIVSSVAMLMGSIAFLFLVDNFWLQLVNAAFLAIALTQTSFLGHDSGHRQIFRSTKLNDWTMLGVCFLVALDRTWWLDKHNRHHANPNHEGLDDDINVTVVSFSESQALARKGIIRWITKYQAYLFFPMLMLTGVSMRGAGITHLATNLRRSKYGYLELVLIAAHLSTYLAIVWFAFGPWWHSVLFVVVNQMLLGLYMGSVFAPNHKGMLVVEEGSKLDFLRSQVLTSRNVRPSRFADFWYGGLNYQIEHHLFPVMPRNRLREAQPVVKQFCEEHGVSYHETGNWQSLREIAGYLHKVSAPLRVRPTA